MRLLALPLPLVLVGAGCEPECKCGVGLDLALPRDGAVDVPTNTKIWLGGDGCPEGGAAELAAYTHIRDADGIEVDFTSSCILTQLAYERMVVLHPSLPLAAQTLYTLEFYSPRRIEPVVWQFRTGAGPASGSPSMPVIQDVRLVSDERGACEDIRYAAFSVTANDEIVVLDADETSSLDVKGLSGTVTALANDPTDLILGSTPCRGDNFPGGTSRKGATTVRLAALDLAGNFSGWTEPEDVSLSGCRVGSDPLSAGWLIFLCFWQRKRRVREP